MKQQNSFAIKLIVIVVFCEANIKKNISKYDQLEKHNSGSS